MLRCSFGVCTSYKLGPKLTASISGIVRLMRPHSSPACTADTTGSLPVSSLYVCTATSRARDWGEYSHAGYSETLVKRPPARSAQHCNTCTISSSELFTELRTEMVNVRVSSSCVRMPLFKLVCTKPGMSMLIY